MRLRALISRRSPSPPKPSVVTRGLIEHFDFADGKGTEATLKSRVSDNVLTLSGFNFDENSGWTGKGLRFDGVDDFVEILNKSITDVINPASFSVEVKCSSSYLDDNTSVFTLAHGSTDLQYRLLGDSNFIFDNKSKLTGDYFTVSMENGLLKTYCNGEEDIYKEASFDDCIKRRAVFGATHAMQNRIDFFSKCIIHSIKIYNVALTPEEIAQNYEYEQSIDRTTASTYPLLQEELSYGIGLSNQLSEEQKATFRLSLDGTKFVAGLRYCEGLEVEEFTYSEIQVEMEKEEWSKIEELE